MSTILYVNACVRASSRTDRLARALLCTLHGTLSEIRLADETLLPMNAERLSARDDAIREKDFSAPAFRAAKQFREADTIVLSAPYWEMSFPSLVKLYVENVTVNGLTFRYSEEGFPISLCRATDFYYVSTAGGNFDPRFGYEQLRTLFSDMFGIGNAHLLYAERLDIRGEDPEGILSDAAARYGLSL